jgi:hypothetical protein
MKYTSVIVWTYDYSLLGQHLQDLVNKITLANKAMICSTYHKWENIEIRELVILEWPLRRFYLKEKM